LFGRQREEVPDGFPGWTTREKEALRGHDDGEQRSIAAKDTGIV